MCQGYFKENRPKVDAILYSQNLKKTEINKFSCGHRSGYNYDNFSRCSEVRN